MFGEWFCFTNLDYHQIQTIIPPYSSN